MNKSIIKFTAHAKKQMIKRKIKEGQVLLTLNYPDNVVKGSHSHETIAIKHFGSKRIRVIYVSEPNEIRIITATH